MVTSGTTLAGLEALVAETQEQVSKSNRMVNYIASSQSEIEDFLKTI
jgi:hypothetical protein